MPIRNEFDVIVVGGGMAGVATATRLGELGAKTAIIEKQSKHPEKSLFVNGNNRIPEWLQDQLIQQNAQIPCPDLLLTNLDNPLDLVVKPTQAATYAVFHPPILDAYTQKYSDQVEPIKDRVVTAEESDQGVDVTLISGKTITAERIVDATGNYSQLSRLYKSPSGRKTLDDDPYVLWVKGIRAYGEFIPGQLICPIGKEVGLAWILPYSKNYGDIVAADYARMSEINPAKDAQMLAALIRIAQKNDWAHIQHVEGRFSSFIRCEPIPTSASKSNRLYQVGEAAGMGSPLMAEVVPTALHWGDELAKDIVRGRKPHDFYRRWRETEQMFPYDLELAMLNKRLERRKKGRYGGNASLYQEIINKLPEEGQQEVLTHRKVPRRYWPNVLRAIVTNPSLAKNAVETIVELAKVKIHKLAHR